MVEMFYTVFALVACAFVAILGAVSGGAIVAIILGTVALAGFAVLPTEPFIPLWVVVAIVLTEAIYVAYKIAQMFGFGRSGE